MPLLFSLGGCAHSAAKGAASDAAEEKAELEREVASLRRENARLQKELRSSEERIRHLQSDGGEGGRYAHGLPVVKLSPEGQGPQAQGPDEEEGPPRRRARSVRLADVPYSGYQEESAAPSDPAAFYGGSGGSDGYGEAPTPAAAPKSYRLVGSRLVAETKRKRAPRAKPKRGSQDPVVTQYQSAMGVYRDGKLAAAERAFAAVVAAHPNHDYADNALYWKGEAAYDQEHYADALAAFTEVVERYGGGNKAPDALLKIGLCYGRLGDRANAQDVLTQLIAAYPDARATGIARDKLANFAEG